MIYYNYLNIYARTKLYYNLPYNQYGKELDYTNRDIRST